MDVNGVPFWQLRGGASFGFGDAAPAWSAPRDLEFDDARGALRLADLDQAPDLVEDEVLAREWAGRPSAVCDPHDTFAWWDGGLGRIVAGGAAGTAAGLGFPGLNGIDTARPDDLAFADDVLLIVRDGAVTMVDVRDRWPPEVLLRDDFAVSRAAAADGHDPWLLDCVHGRLARLKGTPLPEIARAARPDASFAQVPADPHAPLIVICPGDSIPAAYEPVMLRVNTAGEPAVLCYQADGGAVVFLYQDGVLRASRPLAGIRSPTSLAWAGTGELLVTASNGAGEGAGEGGHAAGRVYAYDLAQLLATGGPLRPNGRYIPLLDDAGLGLCNAAGDQARHIALAGDPQPRRQIRRLVALSRAAYAASGSVLLGPIDGGSYDCQWHRLYFEADLPEGCGLRIALHAANRDSLPAFPDSPATQADWALHLAGDAAPWVEPVPDPELAAVPPQWPRAGWSHSQSEIPGHQGFAPCLPRPGRAGLFTCLVQDGRRRVRDVSGRYLYVLLELTSSGRISPELFALRVYGHRFSYRDRYLPELYRESLSGSDAQAVGGATPADFLERFVHLLEGPMSEMEGRVANSWTITDPVSVPDKGIDWLASWTGFDFRGDGNPVRKRQKLRCAPYLRRYNGTLAGLNAVLELETGGQLLSGGQLDPDGRAPRPGQMAQIETAEGQRRALVLAARDPRGGQLCDVLTGGAVTTGTIVVVEGFRLRRTMATLIGVQLADETDPLLPGLTRSGNSVVGDTLWVSEGERAELLAHFDVTVPRTTAERAALEQFYLRLAHRVLILVRREAGLTGDSERLLAAARAIAPAHVELSLLEMATPFVTGVASLVGIDSFLAEPVPDEPFRVEQSQLGQRDFIFGRGTLDRRGEVPATPPPRARADGPATTAQSGFRLDASRSAAAQGRSVNRYIWTWN